MARDARPPRPKGEAVDPMDPVSAPVHQFTPKRSICIYWSRRLCENLKVDAQERLQGLFITHPILLSGLQNNLQGPWFILLLPM